jgi:hypothetical protein
MKYLVKLIQHCEDYDPESNEILTLTVKSLERQQLFQSLRPHFMSLVYNSEVIVQSNTNFQVVVSDSLSVGKPISWETLFGFDTVPIKRFADTLGIEYTDMVHLRNGGR